MSRRQLVFWSLRVLAWYQECCSSAASDVYKRQNEVQRMPYLFQTEGAYKGSPKRTTAGGEWLNGYSDHLPVVVYLLKQQ